jgi:uncharacterized protein involved in exopolysaccharide biosynthesis
VTASGQRTERLASIQRGDTESAEEVSFLGLANVVLRYRGLVALTALITALIVVSVVLILPRTYTSQSTFMPQAKKNPTGLSGLAAQFGFTLPLTDPGQSPAFYADLATSRTILGQVVETTYRFDRDGKQVEGSLIAFYKSKGETPERRRDAAIRRLKDEIEATTVQKTGTVELAVTSRQPGLALQINRRVLDLINEFNLRTRQSQAAEERRFTERRLGEVRQDLRAAEDRLQQFLQRNRDLINSPELMFQRDRLQREVAMQQEVFTSLANAVEQAKIEEVRDTPVLTTVQQPEAPVRPDRRGLVVKAILALLGGSMLGGILALWRAYTTNALRTGSVEAVEFQRLRREAAKDLLHPWRALGRLWRTARSGRHDSIT